MDLEMSLPGLSFFKRNPKGQPTLDIAEAFGLWLLLYTRYVNLHQLLVLRNFIHDRDLAVVTNTVIDNFKSQAETLEKEGANFNVKVPGRHPTDEKTSADVELFTDEFIYNLVFTRLRDDLFLLNRTVRSAATNDRFRGVLRDFLTVQVNTFNQVVKYGKLKEWQDPAPTFKTARAVKKERLDIGEAIHLWEYLSLRYDQIQLTEFFASFAHDTEYQAILNRGIGNLKSQAAKIERVVVENEIPLPKRPPVSIQAPIDPETLEDNFTYRVILRGIQEALDLHLRAIVETTRNDALREMFTEFLSAELDFYDKFLKYGKMKGWPSLPPTFAQPV
ncbi:MAG: DUF3231 family protein [Bacillota bacterium]